jgi:hypothetical protein
MTIDTFGSDFDTMLHIYTGWQNGFASLIPVTDNDDTDGLQSQVEFPVHDGQFYEIRVAGYNGAQGNILLNLDFVAGAPDITVAPLNLSVTFGDSSPSPTGPGSSSAPRLIGMTASPHAFEETQPDGTPVRLHIRGGVDFHWLEDQDGYTVLKDGPNYVYARLDQAGRLTPSDLLVGKANPSHAGLHRRTLPSPEVVQQLQAERLSGLSTEAVPPTAVLPMGAIKNVVILMRFSNHAGRTLPSNTDFNTLFNGVGGDPLLAPTGSVRDYYLETSYGAMALDSTVYGWVTLPETEQYYANGNSGVDSTIREAITTALDLADELIDFSDFDADGNSYVDSITFIHSGYGAEWGGTDADGADYTSRIWSHRWYIPTWTSAEGVRVRDYHISPGLWGTRAAPTPAGLGSSATRQGISLVCRISTISMGVVKASAPMV